MDENSKRCEKEDASVIQCSAASVVIKRMQKQDPSWRKYTPQVEGAALDTCLSSVDFPFNVSRLLRRCAVNILASVSP